MVEQFSLLFCWTLPQFGWQSESSGHWQMMPLRLSCWWPLCSLEGMPGAAAWHGGRFTASSSRRLARNGKWQGADLPFQVQFWCSICWVTEWTLLNCVQCLCQKNMAFCTVITWDKHCLHWNILNFTHWKQMANVFMLNCHSAIIVWSHLRGLGKGTFALPPCHPFSPSFVFNKKLWNLVPIVSVQANFSGVHLKCALLVVQRGIAGRGTTLDFDLLQKVLESFFFGKPLGTRLVVLLDNGNDKNCWTPCCLGDLAGAIQVHFGLLQSQVMKDAKSFDGPESWSAMRWMPFMEGKMEKPRRHFCLALFCAMSRFLMSPRIRFYCQLFASFFFARGVGKRKTQQRKKFNFSWGNPDRRLIIDKKANIKKASYPKDRAIACNERKSSQPVFGTSIFSVAHEVILCIFLCIKTTSTSTRDLFGEDGRRVGRGTVLLVIRILGGVVVLTTRYCMFCWEVNYYEITAWLQYTLVYIAVQSITVVVIKTLVRYTRTVIRASSFVFLQLWEPLQAGTANGWFPYSKPAWIFVWWIYPKFLLGSDIYSFEIKIKIKTMMIRSVTQLAIYNTSSRAGRCLSHIRGLQTINQKVCIWCMPPKQIRLLCHYASAYLIETRDFTYSKILNLSFCKSYLK